MKKLNLDLIQIKDMYESGLSTRDIASKLNTNKTTILGLLRENNIAVRKLGDHRRTHGMKKTRIYRIWHGMKNRCLNAKTTSYERYGGRGITIYNDWLNFSDFKDWALNNGYEETLTIDRINNNGNYEPSNCRWADRKTQQNNTRWNHLISINGITKTMSQWAEVSNLSPQVIARRINVNKLSGIALIQPKVRNKRYGVLSNQVLEVAE